MLKLVMKKTLVQLVVVGLLNGSSKADKQDNSLLRQVEKMALLASQKRITGRYKEQTVITHYNLN